MSYRGRTHLTWGGGRGEEGRTHQPTTIPFRTSCCHLSINCSHASSFSTWRRAHGARAQHVSGGVTLAVQGRDNSVTPGHRPAEHNTAKREASGPSQCPRTPGGGGCWDGGLSFHLQHTSFWQPLADEAHETVPNNVVGGVQPRPKSLSRPIGLVMG